MIRRLSIREMHDMMTLASRAAPTGAGFDFSRADACVQVLPACHPRSGTIFRYYPNERTLTVSCVVCDHLELAVLLSEMVEADLS